MDTIDAFRPEAVIVGGGDFPTHPFPLGLIKETERIVCCDGAANEFLKRGMKLWRVVGDCDSLLPEAYTAFTDILRPNPDQETNDQTKAVTYLAKKGMRRIAIVAATGRREDHTLGNISLLIEYMHRGMEVRMYTDYGVFIPCRNNRSFRCPIGTAVSIFSFGTQGMEAEGLRYPLRDFTTWWQGTLNTAEADTFTIRCKGDYLVYLNYP
ncbi:MAG: thiamine diphosphokinase [Bacteroidaceae bacterium]|nr:thiamine diphosphokinase [Bacteroidaceae bacterium]